MASAGAEALRDSPDLVHNLREGGRRPSTADAAHHRASAPVVARHASQPGPLGQHRSRSGGAWGDDGAWDGEHPHPVLEEEEEEWSRQRGRDSWWGVPVATSRARGVIPCSATSPERGLGVESCASGCTEH
jgi:hypothetical protein